MVVNLTWVAGGFRWGACLWTSGEAARGMGKKCALYNYPVPSVQIVGTARRDMNRKNSDGAGKGVRVSLPHPNLLIFLPLSYFAQHSAISTPGISYDYKQTASYTGVPRTRLNKPKNSALVLQIAINTETYVITSTTMTKIVLFNLYTPLKVSSSKSWSVSLSSIVFFTGWCDIHFACSFNWTPYHSSCVKKISIHIKYNNNDSYLLYTVVN